MKRRGVKAKFPRHAAVAWFFGIQKGAYPAPNLATKTGKRLIFSFLEIIHIFRIFRSFSEDGTPYRLHIYASFQCLGLRTLEVTVVGILNRHKALAVKLHNRE